MRSFSSLSNGIKTALRTPSLIGVVLLYALLAAGMTLTQFVDPLLMYAAVAVTYLLLPFFVGGTVALVGEALDGGGSLRTFFGCGARNYLSLLGGGLLLGFVTLVLYLVVGFLAGIVGVVAVSALGFDPVGGVSTGALVLVWALSLVVLLIVLLPLFLSQFFPAQVVLDDAGVLESFKRSFGLVTGNLGSVVVFDVVAVLISLPTQAGNVYLFGFAGDSLEVLQTGQPILTTLSTTELAVYLGLILVTSVGVGAVSYAYYVSFYERLRTP